MKLGVHVCPSYFFERLAVKNQDEARLAWTGVDD